MLLLAFIKFLMLYPSQYSHYSHFCTSPRSVFYVIDILLSHLFSLLPYLQKFALQARFWIIKITRYRKREFSIACIYVTSLAFFFRLSPRLVSFRSRIHFTLISTLDLFLLTGRLLGPSLHYEVVNVHRAKSEHCTLQLNVMRVVISHSRESSIRVLAT